MTHKTEIETVGKVLDDIAAERLRQVEGEGWSATHDDGHTKGELAMAAATYAQYSAGLRIHRDRSCPINWPWSIAWWKPSDRRRDLVKAAALLVAEIERLDRASAQ